MRTWIFVAMMAALAFMTTNPAGAQEKTARMIVYVAGNHIATNDILFDYANSMNLGDIEKLGEAHPTDMVRYTDLIPLLPSALKGWSADTPEGLNMEVSGVKYSFAENTYHKTAAEDEVTVLIWDTVNQEKGPWYAFWYGQKMSFETDDAYARTKEVKGYPAWEYRDKKQNEGWLGIGLVMATPVPEMGNLILIVPALLSAGIIARKMRP